MGAPVEIDNLDDMTDTTTEEYDYGFDSCGDEEVVTEKSKGNFEVSQHSSEIKGLCSMKCSSETLQNLLYFMYQKTHAVFFVFHFVQLYIFTL